MCLHILAQLAEDAIRHHVHHTAASVQSALLLATTHVAPTIDLVPMLSLVTPMPRIDTAAEVWLSHLTVL